jgi:hypothetical protein
MNYLLESETRRTVPSENVVLPGVVRKDLPEITDEIPTNRLPAGGKRPLRIAGISSLTQIYFCQGFTANVIWLRIGES